MSSPELSISHQSAADIHHANARALEELLRDQPPGPQESDCSTPASPTKALTAAELLSTAALPRFSTFSPSLDRLIARHSTATSQGHMGYEWITNEQIRGSVMPGMSVEISGPPGSGKTVIGLSLALSARMQNDDNGSPEVLIIGSCWERGSSD